jgi:hypothetical protein
VSLRIDDMVIAKRKSARLGLMDAGFLAPLIEEFGSNLEALAHTSLTIRAIRIPPGTLQRGSVTQVCS